MPDVNGLKGRILKTEKDGTLIIQVSAPDRPLMKSFIQRYFAKAKNKAVRLDRPQTNDDLPILNFNFAFWYKKRTLDQNALYWALLSILSYEVFGEFFHEEEIHEEILGIYSPRIQSALTKRLIPKRSKYLTTVEFSSLIEGVFKELAVHGVSVDVAEKIHLYWREWYTWRGTTGGDPLAGSYKNVMEYKERIPYCEACLKYLGHDNPGSIAHIVAKAQGGSLDDWNIFHLCDTCHTGLNPESEMLDFDRTVSQHQHGWEAFLEKYPHLRWKYEEAQRLHAEVKYPATALPAPEPEGEDEPLENLELF